MYGAGRGLSVEEARDWGAVAPHFAALQEERLSVESIPGWLERWSDLQKMVRDVRAGLKRARLRDLTDEAAGEAWDGFIERVWGPFGGANDALTRKLLAEAEAAGYVPVPRCREMFRRFGAEAGLFREENLPLLAEIDRLVGRYYEMASTMTVFVDGVEVAGPELLAMQAGPDRGMREAGWRAEQAAWDEAAEAIGALFLEVVALRKDVARNAGLADYRAYRWRELGRLDYEPGDALALDEAIAAEIVPLAARLRRQKAAGLGLDRIRPWDLPVRIGTEGDGAEARLFADCEGFEEGMVGLFGRMDPELGALFGRMSEGYLDLGWRKGKPSGAEEWCFLVSGTPYIRLDKEGTEEAVALLLHEMGHAFHDYLSLAHQRLVWNLGGPTEFEEFAAISMPYLAAHYLEEARGGFYTREQAMHATMLAVEEACVRWLPYIAQVDAFQHWLYTEAPEELRAEDLDATWLELSERYAPAEDWGPELEGSRGRGWQRAGWTFGVPFYMLEYALAHLGALQVWRNSMADYARTWQAYRGALALGNTLPLPELFRAAGVRFPMDDGVVGEMAGFLAAVLPGGEWRGDGGPAAKPAGYLSKVRLRGLP